MQNSESPYLTPAQVARRYSVSLPTLWRWRRDGRLPEPRHLGPNTVRFHLAELLEFEQRSPKEAA